MSRVRHQEDRKVRRARFWADVRALSRPLIAYWLLMLVSLGMFCGAILTFNQSAKDVTALLTITASVVVATIVGQVTAIARIRGWIVGLVTLVLWIGGGIFSAVTAAQLGDLGLMMFIFVFMFPFFAVGGRYSLRAGRAFAGTWVPLMFNAGTVITVAEKMGRAKAWHAGEKYAIWDVVTLIMLAVVLILILVYLVQREIHRLHLWGTGSKAPLAVQSEVKHTKGAMSLSIRGWLLLVLIGLLMTAAVAVISPYLFRTGDRDGEGRSDSTSQNTSQDGSSKPKPKPQDGDGDGLSQKELEELMEKYGPIAERATSILGMLLMLLLLTLLGLFVGWRPGKRLWMVNHGQRPMWKVAPSDRIRNSWRLIEIALGDLGVCARPNEPAEQLYRRSLPALSKIEAAGAEVTELGQAAAIRDRVTYGLGIGPEDVNLMERVARWAYRTVWDRQGEWAQIKSLYRGLG